MPLPPSPAPSPFIDGHYRNAWVFGLLLAITIFSGFGVAYCLKRKDDQREEAQRNLVALQRPHRPRRAAAASAQKKRPAASGVFKYARDSGSFDSTECAICLNKYIDGEVCRFLPKCNHTFHRECIDKWLTKGSDCPLCRAQV